MRKATQRPKSKNKKIEDDTVKDDFIEIIFNDPNNPNRRISYKIPKNTDPRKLEDLIKLSSSDVDVDLDLIKALLDLGDEEIVVEVK